MNALQLLQGVDSLRQARNAVAAIAVQCKRLAASHVVWEVPQFLGSKEGQLGVRCQICIDPEPPGKHVSSQVQALASLSLRFSC